MRRIQPILLLILISSLSANGVYSTNSPLLVLNKARFHLQFSGKYSFEDGKELQLAFFPMNHIYLMGAYITNNSTHATTPLLGGSLKRTQELSLYDIGVGFSNSYELNKTRLWGGIQIGLSEANSKFGLYNFSFEEGNFDRFFFLVNLASVWRQSTFSVLYRWTKVNFPQLKINHFNTFGSAYENLDYHGYEYDVSGSFSEVFLIVRAGNIIFAEGLIGFILFEEDESNQIAYTHSVDDFIVSVGIGLNFNLFGMNNAGR